MNIPVFGLTILSGLEKSVCLCRYAQFSSLSSGTLRNSLMLLLTRIMSRDRASAAIQRSFAPMGLPACSRCALIRA